MPQDSITLPAELRQYIVDTTPKNCSFSRRTAELIEKGMNAEQCPPKVKQNKSK